MPIYAVEVAETNTYLFWVQAANQESAREDASALIGNDNYGGHRYTRDIYASVVQSDEATPEEAPGPCWTGGPEGGWA